MALSLDRISKALIALGEALGHRATVEAALADEPEPDKQEPSKEAPKEAPKEQPTPPAARPSDTTGRR